LLSDTEVGLAILTIGNRRHVPYSDAWQQGDVPALAVEHNRRSAIPESSLERV
jgi:hypothetical protein